MQVGMQPGPYRFTVSKAGFAPVTSEVRVPLGDALQLDTFKLSPATVATGGGDELKRQFAAAVAKQTAGQLDQAEAAYKALLAQAPDVPEVYQNLGSIYARQGRVAEALPFFLEALRFKRSFPDALFNAGTMPVFSRKWGEGKKLDEIVTEFPVMSGTVGPDVIDIGKLYAQTGMFTYDPGFTSTGSCDSKITYIDGDAGILGCLESRPQRQE